MDRGAMAAHLFIQWRGGVGVGGGGGGRGGRKTTTKSPPKKQQQQQHTNQQQPNNNNQPMIYLRSVTRQKSNNVIYQLFLPHGSWKEGRTIAY